MIDVHNDKTCIHKIMSLDISPPLTFKTNSKEVNFLLNNYQMKL